MRAIAAFLLMSFAAAAGAQPAAQLSLRTVATSIEIQRSIAEAAASIKPGEPVALRPLLAFAPYKATLEYRVAATHPAVHQDAAEFFYVIEGSGALIQGGAMTEAKSVDAHNLSGVTITGGASSHVAAGDVLVIPEGTPHWFNAVDGRLVMISMKIPRPVAPF